MLRSKSGPISFVNRSFPRITTPINQSTATASSFISNGARNVFMKFGKRNNEILEYGDYYYHADGSCGHKSHSNSTGRWNVPTVGAAVVLPLTNRAKEIVSQPMEFRKLKQAIRNRGAVTGMSLRQLVPFMLRERWEKDDEDEDDSGSTSTASTTFFGPHEQEKIFLDNLKEINETILESSCSSTTMSSEDDSSSSSRTSPETTPEEEMEHEQISCGSDPSSKRPVVHSTNAMEVIRVD